MSTWYPISDKWARNGYDGISGTALKVLGILATFRTNGTNTASPAETTIKDCLDGKRLPDGTTANKPVGIKTIQRALQELEQAGIITKHRNWRRNQYTINPHVIPVLDKKPSRKKPQK